MSDSLQNLDLQFQGLREDWTPYLGPVVNQGECANCWAESLVQMFNGITNKYLNEDVRKHYGNKDGLILLSADQLTHCTEMSFLKSLDLDYRDQTPG